VCLFWNNVSQQNRFLLLVLKHLAMCILVRKCRKRQYTDWQEYFGTQEVLARDKPSSSHKTAGITIVLSSSSVSTATTAYGFKNLISPLI
jgi:hypothetical protein